MSKRFLDIFVDMSGCNCGIRFAHRRSLRVRPVDRRRLLSVTIGDGTVYCLFLTLFQGKADLHRTLRCFEPLHRARMSSDAGG